MRALLVASAAAAALVGLTGCGEATDPAAEQPQPPPSEPMSTVVEPTGPLRTDVTPTPPNTKPRDAAPPPTGVPTAPVSLSPTGPVVPPGVEQVPPSQVDAGALPEHYEHRGLVWVYDGGYSLQTFAAASSGCAGAEARTESQSATEVRITLLPLPQPQGGPADGPVCTTVITPRPVTVALDAPLGDRTVVLTASR